jgi:hypothetical protein
VHTHRRYHTTKRVHSTCHHCCFVAAGQAQRGISLRLKLPRTNVGGHVVSTTLPSQARFQNIPERKNIGPSESSIWLLLLELAQSKSTQEKVLLSNNKVSVHRDPMHRHTCPSQSKCAPRSVLLGKTQDDQMKTFCLAFRSLVGFHEEPPTYGLANKGSWQCSTARWLRWDGHEETLDAKAEPLTDWRQAPRPNGPMKKDCRPGSSVMWQCQDGHAAARCTATETLECAD